MTTMTMNFVAPQGVTGATAATGATGAPNGGGRTLLRIGRRLSDALRASLNVDPQDRADKYVTLMPIAVLAA
ncbi:hypothetical protein [Mycobacterium angelicum]|uniref:Uncharacterized protein n=1 Tax=Mycobacterium angelicum TaxID=470074 RepID=A0A1W9ZTN0_MYCAN|nr:hypothetical protein [Mycobacterium angelicum]MCV7199214.1 hypothetical protein [Mycobacterium angelicum]ORA21103.1 hypothetical protein BST12_13690 [Mycobacterium angelicum]